MKQTTTDLANRSRKKHKIYTNFIKMTNDNMKEQKKKHSNITGDM